MPRAKDNAPAAADPDNGFAALEVKVEELQREAAAEAETVVEAASDMASAMIPEPDSAPDYPPGFPEPDAADLGRGFGADALVANPAALLKTTLGALTACTESALRLQAATLASFARVRSPRDLLEAQMEYGRQALELYTSNMARLTQAVPVPAR